MTEIFTAIPEAAAAMSLWELVAVVLSLAYLILAVRQNILCWPAAIGGCSIYIVLMYQAGLYMESALQLFYIAMAVYGWVTWSRGVNSHELPVSSWPPVFHLLPLMAIAVLTWLSGAWLDANTAAALPYADSFTTWGAVVTTWMVARKVLQNWHYWLVIDSVSLFLYVSRELYLTAGLFCIYIVLIFVGYRSWRRSMATCS